MYKSCGGAKNNEKFAFWNLDQNLDSFKALMPLIIPEEVFADFKMTHYS